MKVAQAIVRCLEAENVTQVFGYPGGAVLPLYEALRTSRIDHCLVRHEQAAVHSANGYARSGKTVGVAIATSGPGATNLITGIANAYMDSIPLVVLTGQVKSSLIGRDVFQEVDITGATESVTKHSYLVKEADQICRIMKEAFHIASTGRMGPVLVDLPVDIQTKEVSFSYNQPVDIPGYKPTIKGHMGQMKRALKRLKSSERPLVCAGGGVISAGAVPELHRFMEKGQLPLVHTLMGVSAVATDHPLNIGMIGSHGFLRANQAVAEADLLIVVGARVADRTTQGSDVFADQADIIHIDIDPAEIGKNLGTLIPVVGDARVILSVLADELPQASGSLWVDSLAADAGPTKEESSASGFVDPKRVARLLSDFAPEDAIITADVGQNQHWVARNFPFRSGQRFLTSGGLGTMGYSLPAAIGAKIGCPASKVFAVVGDGGLQMSQSELATVSRLRLPMVILLFNNGVLGMVKELQDKGNGHPFAIDLDHNPDFVQLAAAYGIVAERVTRDEDVVPALQRAAECEGPCLIEFAVNASESTLEKRTV